MLEVVIEGLALLLDVLSPVGATSGESQRQDHAGIVILGLTQRPNR